MENIFNGHYQTDENTTRFSDITIASFDRSKDNTNRNRVGDRGHAKNVKNSGFQPG